MASRRPDFIIGGAPRSGTSWLYTMLERHPSVYMAKPITPEPKFFLVDEIYEKGMDYYSTLFSDARAGQVAGEKSTNYMESTIAAERIRSHLPGVKLIFMLRDPVERAYSNYLWSCQNGFETEPFEKALAEEELRERALPAPLRYARPHAYFSRGLYADMLLTYFNLFPREQILCLLYEDIIEASEELAAKVHNFIGIKPRPNDVSGLGKINAANHVSQAMLPDTRKRLTEAYAEPNGRLSRLLGKSFPLWKTKLEYQ